MDADGSSKRSRPVRRAVKKLKFKPKVPPQKPKKLTEPQQEEPKPVDDQLLKILRTHQVAAKGSPDTKDKRSTQNPPSTPPPANFVSLSPAQPGAHKQNQSKTLQILRSFPVPVNSGILYNEESDDDDDYEDDDNDNIDLQEPQLSSIECETSTRPAEELDLLKQDQDSKERMFLFQLPKSLPLPRNSSSVIERKGKAPGKDVKEASNLQQLPHGYLGKMLVYKSGKIKMKLGDVMFDVNPGAESRMTQHAVALNTREKHCCLLGEIDNRHVIVTPDVDSLLNHK